MSKKLFQGIINQTAEVYNQYIAVIDKEGNVMASTGEGVDSDLTDAVNTDDLVPGKVIQKGPFSCYLSDSTDVPEFAVAVKGVDQESSRLAAMLGISLVNIRQYYDEKYDRTNFIKNVVLDNILPGDVYVKARELNINVEGYRVAILIRTLSKTDVSVYEVVSNLFPDKQKDFLINLSESDIVLIKELKSDHEAKYLDKLGRSIVDTLGSEFYTQAVVGIGTVVTSVEDLARSFREAQVALEVGKVFDIEKSIVSYDNLGIARLIYQLPLTLCEMFLKEVFKKGSIDSLDHETLFTIQRFFENNLNVSETSRKLFVHRNTLVYRLEKIRKLTGLDLREFDHAIVFKVALMVKKYLVSNPVKF